ncbi:EpsG family protein [Maribacter sp. PR1]|uniref:EpsG family protein n=1 Tax=Maribacter cobaltidurans TaxID=1178778 RepID=A0ABU7IXB5_9FLAO|nr:MULTISPECIES: EpsG family protein [Maribacter]MDC6389771.1 EpsG family protein [Maribacter sp. PR1]MEE1977161.1 EpsG family protein [Maribacter cobaltidurans]
MLQSFVVYGGLMLIMIFLGARYTYTYNNGMTQKEPFWQLEIMTTILVFAFICGIRYDVGVDYPTYLKTIKYVNNHPFVSSLTDYEIGFVWILKFFANLNAHFAWVFGFFAFLQLFFIYYAFKKERYLYPFLAFIIMTGGLYFTMMNEIRQSVVWCILILAVQFANRKNILIYFSLMLVGLIFHKSAIMFIPLYFILNSDKDFFKSIKLQILLLFSVMALAEVNVWDALMDQITFLIEIFNYGDRYGDLASRMEIWQMDYSKGIRYYGPFVIYFLIIIHSKKLKTYFKKTTFIKYYNLFFIGVLLFFITYTNTLMQRPARYFIVMQLVISAYFLYYFWYKHQKTIMNILLLIMFILLHLAILFAFLKSDHATNYLFFWEN